MLSCGVLARASSRAITLAAKPPLVASRSRALEPEEASALLRNFAHRRRELVQEILVAGRTPEMPRGGYLQTSEPSAAP